MMTQMESIIISNLTDSYLADLPRAWAVVVFRSEGLAQYALITGDLRQRLKSILSKETDSNVYSEMLTICDEINWQQYEKPLDALIAYKTILTIDKPIQQQALFAQRDYVYLALNAQTFPFIKIADYTIENWNYVGPFRSRFVLADFIDSVSRILMLPNCETGTFPCEKFDLGTCRGWCLNLAPEAESDTARDIAKLEKLLFESYMTPTDTIIDMLKTEHDKYFDDLEFEKAELFSDAIKLHEFYKDWLEFLIEARRIDYRDDRINVQSGQLKAYHDGKDWIDLHCQELSFNPNEFLALDKSLADEARILYNYIKYKEVR